MNKFLKGLLSEIVRYTNDNIHLINFGNNNFLVKMGIKLVLRKVQLAVDTGSIDNFDWKQIIKDLGSITR